ncbi:MAG: 2-(1,2-epoxy-1,2-dihydrophenyl)acetyl-CoA isomerase [Chitinophagales bacterium]|nr:2-(1,2-epoxy-1,2-dihydrophenyl)acetyl-CoA isomerase [Chitinophagales bacterium]
MFNTLIYDVKDKICTITLDRPEVFNAFNDQMSFELQDALKKAKKDEGIRVLVITGAGKAFCSGQDLKDFQSNNKKSFAESLYQRYNPIIRGVRQMPKPVICRLNGVAAGAGCSLALACDMIIASSKANLIEVFVNVGLVLDSGSSFFLPSLVGYNKAFEIATMGNKVSAEEAKSLGIINYVTSPEELDEKVNSIAGYYANAPTKAIAMMKKMLNKALGSDLDTMLEYEAFCQEIAGRSMDYKEGLKAFLEKRKPEFSGN